MRFTVTWEPSAVADLAKLWITAPDRKALTEAADRIEQVLRDDPDRKGEEFYGDRLLIEPPLAVVFVVKHADREVQVVGVWHR